MFLFVFVLLFFLVAQIYTEGHVIVLMVIFMLSFFSVNRLNLNKENAFYEFCVFLVSPYNCQTSNNDNDLDMVKTQFLRKKRLAYREKQNWTENE